MKTASISRN